MGVHVKVQARRKGENNGGDSDLAPGAFPTGERAQLGRLLILRPEIYMLL